MFVFGCACVLLSNLLWRWEWSGDYVVRCMCLLRMRGTDKYNFNAGDGSILYCLSVCQSVYVLAPVCLCVSMCVVVGYCVYLFSVFAISCLRFAFCDNAGDSKMKF